MNSMLGTIGYIAPEILNGEKYSFKVDIYSFSQMAIQIITEIWFPIDIKKI